MLKLHIENTLDREEKIMAEWIDTHLSDILIDKGYIRGPFGSALKRGDMKEDGIPVYEQQHAIYNSRDFRYYIDEQKFNEMNRFQVKKDDLIISCSGTVGKVSIIKDNDPKGIISQALLLLRADTNKVLPLYLKYFFSSREGYNAIVSRSSGSVQVNIAKRSVIEQIPLKLPRIKTQRKIVGVLNSIDEKIEENERINNNLLEQALTLYATQFSSLELNGCIGDYCSVKSGFAFKSSWWTNSGIRVIKIGSINQDNLNLLECSYVDEDKADKAKDFVVKAGDLLIAMTGATIGKFAMVPYSSEMLLVNQRVGKFFLGNNPVEKLPFIYCTLKQPEVYGEVVNRGQGSAQPNISASDIMSIPCVIPSQDAINDFNNTSQPLFDLIISNQRENQHLSELRNALLPKLMSGELDVSNIEI